MKDQLKSTIIFMQNEPSQPTKIFFKAQRERPAIIKYTYSCGGSNSWGLFYKYIFFPVDFTWERERASSFLILCEWGAREGSLSVFFFTCNNNSNIKEMALNKQDDEEEELMMRWCRCRCWSLEEERTEPTYTTEHHLPHLSFPSGLG